MALAGIIPVILFSMTLIKAGIAGNIVTVHFKAVLGDCTDNKTVDYQAVQVKSRIHCLTTCSQNDSCKSVIFQKQNNTCLLMKSKTACVAGSDVPNVVYAITGKPGLNPGSDETTQISLETTSIPELVTTELMPLSSTVDPSTVHPECHCNGNKVILIQPVASLPAFLVKCEQNSINKTVILRNKQEDSSFLNRDLQDFKRGFGNVNADHMQSLDNIHILTSSYPYDLSIALTSTTYMLYKNVQVANSTFNYKITFDSVQTFLIPNDQLERINGTMFSTRDADNDENDDINCAVRNQKGFWYNSDCNGCSSILCAFGIGGSDIQSMDLHC
ncbi:uncharacterized protein LOC126822225 [Patella vulgata]|uniref:uncharacterized protein LOC126822225 n=1 Tax=Patella vulgata TaxID=6465 RepID=UPI0021804281|nr:uncharacterized protein LOC126822225 [Patella vulgata]